VTALTWSITERPRGTIVTNASMVWTLLCVATEIDVREVIHIPGEENTNCDRLSRRGSGEQGQSVEQAAAEMAFAGATVVDMNGRESVMDILRLCDPRTVLESESDFISFWTRARRAISNFLSAHPQQHTPHSYHSRR
jgi:hypothetical protein